MQILIIQPKIGMGDMIIYLPYIHAISKKYKKSVSLLVKDNSRAKDLLDDDNHINEIITLRKEMDGVSGIFKLTNELKKRNFDKIFIFNSSLRYNLVARLAGIKSIYQYPLLRSKDNIINSCKIFTESITNQVVSTEPNLVIKETNNNLEKSFSILLAPSASGQTKRWAIENYIRLAEEISKRIKCKFYLAGGKNDTDLINRFKNSVAGKNSISFEKMSIKETLPFIKNCNLCISNDTGWAHIAVALQVKTLMIFCDSPVVYGSYSKRISIVEPEGIEKGKTTHNTLGKDKVSFDKVLSESLKLIN